MDGAKECIFCGDRRGLATSRESWCTLLVGVGDASIRGSGGSCVRDGQPLGVRRLIADIRAQGQTHIDSVCIFATAGTYDVFFAASSSGMLDWRPRVAAVNARTIGGGLPLVVALAVGADGVTVYRATTRGRVESLAVSRWTMGEFRAATRRNLLIVRLVVQTRDGKRIELETKTFPVGPNRYNARVARAIVRMGRGIALNRPS